MKTYPIAKIKTLEQAYAFVLKVPSGGLPPRTLDTKKLPLIKIC